MLSGVIVNRPPGVVYSVCRARHLLGFETRFQRVGYQEISCRIFFFPRSGDRYVIFCVFAVRVSSVTVAETRPAVV